MKKSKILVTGSGGFIMSNFIRKTLYDRQNYTITSIDKIKNSKHLNGIYFNKGHEFHIGDICDSHFMNIIFEYEKPDYVVHGAADLTNNNSALNTNIVGTQNIVDNCKKHEVKKLVFTSTAAVYGNNTEQPSNIYSVSKLAAENLIKISELNHSILRLCNVYGPRQSADHLIPKTIKSILNKEDVIVENAEHIREWIYVNDVSNFILLCLEDKDFSYNYDISACYEFSNLEIVQNVCNVLNDGHNLIKCVENLEDKDTRFKAPSSRTTKYEKWKPSKFKSSFESTCSWYLNNKWFLTS